MQVAEADRMTATKQPVLRSTPRALRAGLRRLVGQPCWKARGGGPNIGQWFYLYFGEKVPDGNFRGVQRFTSERYLSLECAWRLETAQEVICSSADHADLDGPMVEGMSRLEGASVTAVSITAPAWDLAIAFDNGLHLKVFCEETLNTNYENYSLRLPSGRHLVVHGGVISDVDEEGVAASSVLEFTSQRVHASVSQPRRGRYLAQCHELHTEVEAPTLDEVLTRLRTAVDSKLDENDMPAKMSIARRPTILVTLELKARRSKT